LLDFIFEAGFDRKTDLRAQSRTPVGDEDLPRKAGTAGMQKFGPMDLKAVTGQPILRISRTDLDNLMSTLEVSFVKLAECLVSPGWRLVLSETDAPGIHYCLSGSGRMVVGDHPPIDLVPHTLIIAPRGLPVEFEATPLEGTPLKTMDGRWLQFDPDALRRFVAGESEPQLIEICGYFSASFGTSIDLFSTLSEPIVERFEASDRLDLKLQAAMAELLAQEVGMGAMITALLKQVLLTLLRRSLSSSDSWVERFSLFGDPQIARAFAEMTSRPGAPHSVQTLSQKVGLSRSVFMARFSEVFGLSPMAVLRQLRMRHAAALLKANHLAIDQVSHRAGYASRSSFFRAFRKAYGRDPSDYRSNPDLSQDQFESPEGEERET
jgi:AraC family transcriptional activator of mtrCDE